MIGTADARGGRLYRGKNLGRLVRGGQNVRDSNPHIGFVVVVVVIILVQLPYPGCPWLKCHIDSSWMTARTRPPEQTVIVVDAAYT